MTRHAKRGFTIIELLTVMLILGILAGIAVPSFAAQSARPTPHGC